MTLKRREAYTELLEVLKRVDKRLLNKIPKGLLNYFERYKANEYEYIYDDNLSLSEQNLSSITLNLLAMLNLNYWCENEEHKKELLSKYDDNERKYQEELREKYNPDNIFNNEYQDNKIKEDIIQEEISLVEYKESVFTRIINKIKQIFHVAQ